MRWFTVLLSLVAVICGLALAFHLTEPAAATCDPPVPGKVLAPPPGQDAIAWEGQVTLSSRCYIAVDALGGPADDHLPSAGSTPDGLVLAVQGGGYSISFDDEGSLVAGRSAAVKYIGVQTLTSVPARSACLSMARDAPAASFSGPGSSVCVLSNGDHVVYLKITGVHADRLHQVQWITADMIEWQQKAS